MNLTHLVNSRCLLFNNRPDSDGRQAEPTARGSSTSFSSTRIFLKNVFFKTPHHWIPVSLSGGSLCAEKRKL